MKYLVILTRDATESTTVTVEADNVSEAEDAALELADTYGGAIDGWEIDDNLHKVYPTGVDKIEETE